ncbi:MAG: DUF1080 domain-containing protein [Planctomycetota bacterium]
MPIPALLLPALLLPSPEPVDPPVRVEPPRSTAGATAGSAAWRSLFDGATLDGWSETGGPYDGDADWTVEDGAIVGREAEGARGGLLYTNELFGDFEFECDVHVTAPFDSGIFVRMLPKQRGAQFTIDDRPGGEICGIYSNGWLYHQTGGDDAWRSGEWCHVRVRCVGDPMHLVAWIDGRCVVDYRVPDGLDTFVRAGRIGIQVHGGRDDPPDAAVRFKNLRVRELPSGAADVFTRADDGTLSLTAVGEAAGWSPLFNGVDLTGWVPSGMEESAVNAQTGEAAGYRVQDGELQALMKGSSGHIRTARTDYADFEYRMDFRISKLSNSGLYLRSIEGGNPSFNGSEVQILDDFNWESASGSKLKPYQFTGGLYGSQAPAKSALRPIGEWNTYQVNCVGPRMQCALNGTILWDVDTRKLQPEQGPPFSERAARGFIGMQRHGSAGQPESDVGVAFRNVFLRELDVSGGTPR